MLFYYVLCIFSLLVSALEDDGVAQVTIKSSNPEADNIVSTTKIAIVGAGIAGASAAYYLSERFPKSPADITVYEARHQVGGRTRSVKVYNGAYGSQHVETGAHSFYTDDECIQSMIDETGLRKKLEPHYPRGKMVGVWDGTSFILRDKRDLKIRTWRKWIHYTWKYGPSVHRFRNWIAAKLPQVQKLLGARETINRDFPKKIQKLGLTAEKRNCAQSCLHNLTSPEFSREIVQATTRAWNTQDLTAINGLATIVAMNPAFTDSIRPVFGGNYKLIDRLIKLSDVGLRLNTSVTRIQRSERRKYRLTVRTDGHQDRSPTNEEANYDAIIIAAPLQAAKIDFDIGVHPVNALTPYVERHVTHFTSTQPDTLSPAFFNVSTTGEIPDKIFTTTNGVSDPGFFSIESSLAYLGLDGCVAQSENMYKVVSAAPLDNSMIAKLLGKSPNSTVESLGVRWIHRQVWHQAFPEYSKNAMLNNIEIADGIFYTGVGEEIVSSLEMSCRMGRFAAELLYYSRRSPPTEI